MKTDSSFKFAVAAILTGVVVSLFATSAQATDDTLAPKRAVTRLSSGTYQDSNGNRGAISTTVTRGEGTHFAVSTITNQGGQTATRAKTRTWDKVSGLGTVSSSGTTFAGAAYSRQGTLTRNTNGSFSSQGTIIRPNGTTVAYIATSVRDATGVVTTGTLTGSAGKSGTFETRVVQSGPGNRIRTTTFTSAGGKVWRRVVATSLNPDGLGTRTITTTRPDGTIRTRSEVFTLTSRPVASLP